MNVSELYCIANFTNINGALLLMVLQYCVHVRMYVCTCMLVHVRNLLPSLPSQESPFGSLWYSMMTIIVYTVGGPDNILLELGNEWSNEYFLFPVVSYILWIVFIVAMSVLFLNLLVSLHVITRCACMNDQKTQTLS